MNINSLSNLKIISSSIVFVIFIITFSSFLQASSTPPSFDCDKVKKGSIAALVCENNELATLDNKLAQTYSLALTKAKNEHPPILKAEQRGWIKGRDDCWKSNDKTECVYSSYLYRIAELQAKYGLVASSSSTVYQCNDNEKNEVTVNFFETTPLIAIAEYGDSVSLMYLNKDSKNKYMGRNETLIINNNSALIKWGYYAKEMQCEGKNNDK